MTLSAPNTTHDDPLADAALAAARPTQAARDVERALVFGDGGRLRRAIDEARQALQVLARTVPAETAASPTSSWAPIIPLRRAA